MQYAEYSKDDRLSDGVRPSTGNDAHQSCGDSKQSTQQARISVRTRNVADQQDRCQSNHGDREAGEKPGAGEGDGSRLP